jgi:putative transcriptional regulator
MPSMRDPYFERSLTYICEHNDEGAMGLVINHPVELTVNQMLEQADIDIRVNDENRPIFAGGPVAQDRGFVLHSPQPQWRSSMQLDDDIMVTTSRDILNALNSEQAPEKYLITLGYAGWTAGQLETELQENSWLTIPADADLLFNVPNHKKWEAAMNKLGIDPWQVSGEIGHA